MFALSMLFLVCGGSQSLQWVNDGKCLLGQADIFFTFLRPFEIYSLDRQTTLLIGTTDSPGPSTDSETKPNTFMFMSVTFVPRISHPCVNPPQYGRAENENQVGKRQGVRVFFRGVANRKVRLVTTFNGRLYPSAASMMFIGI